MKDGDLPVKDGLVILPPVTRMSQGIWATCPVVSDFQASELWEASVDKLPSLVLFLLLAVYSDEGSNLLHVYWALGKIWGWGYSPSCMWPRVWVPIPEKMTWKASLVTYLLSSIDHFPVGKFSVAWRCVSCRWFAGSYHHYLHILSGSLARYFCFSSISPWCGFSFHSCNDGLWGNRRS